MKARLMHLDRDFDLRQPLPWNERALTEDLALETLLRAMARGDRLVHEVARRALLTACGAEADTIRFRQAIVRDALDRPAMVRALYDLTGEAIEGKRRHYFGIWGVYPSSVLHGAVDILQMQVRFLRRLRDLGREHAPRVRSEGLRTFFGMLERELPDEYLGQIEGHLTDLQFRRGVPLSAELGPGNLGRGYILHQPRKDDRPWLRRLFGRRPVGHTFRLHERDEAGARHLGELRDRGISVVANAVGQSADHIDSFFQLLRAELAFYVGCLNLHERLTALGVPTCIPAVLEPGQRGLTFQRLCEPCLALESNRGVVGNTLDVGDRRLVVVTGANQGGKSVFLRSVGVAQLMLQAGMPVAAESYQAAPCPEVATHFKREEDTGLKSGKLDEELSRLSMIVDGLEPGALLLLNESFAATNEREGSEIARQVVTALVEKGMRIFFVTHLHAFAREAFERWARDALFLRAERLPDGTRTFRMVEGEPLATSHGKDLYERIFNGKGAGV